MEKDGTQLQNNNFANVRHIVGFHFLIIKQ